MTALDLPGAPDSGTRDRTGIVVLGVDGGGTRTRAAIVDGAGHFLAIGEGGPSNLHVSGRDAVRDAVATAVEAARSAAGIDSHSFDAAFLGHAGVVTPRDHSEIRAIARELALAPDERVGVDHDLRIALAGTLAGASGIVLIAGTGSSCYGRNADGASWRAGGWGPLLDDPGSGYWIGVQGMATVGRGVDGRGPETILQRTLPVALHVADAGELLRLTGVDGLSRERIAALAPLVLDAANEGDEAARAIVARGVDELALMVYAVAQRLWKDRQTMLAMTGGLTERPAFRSAIESAVAHRAPDVRPVPSRLPPVLGAAALALDALGLLDEAATTMLESQLDPGSVKTIN
jgi:glucosamine kinase